MKKNSKKIFFRCLVLVLLSSISLHVAAQLDTFNIEFCDKMYYEEVVRLGIEVKGRTILLQRVSKNTFVHPLKHLTGNDSTCVIVVELTKSIFKLRIAPTFLQSPRWEICFPQQRRYKKSKDYWCSYDTYIGNGILEPFHYVENDNHGKAILDNR